MIEISKELLSEVFDRKVRTFMLIDNTLYFKYEDIYYGGISGIDDEEINIYELAHKCKEWAFNNGYLIGRNTKLGITIIELDTHIRQHYFAVPFEHFTEYEIKASEWILKEIKK